MNFEYLKNNNDFEKLYELEREHIINEDGQQGWMFSVVVDGLVKTIFLPDAGGRYYEGSLYPRNHGRYWTSCRYYNTYNDWERSYSKYAYTSGSVTSYVFMNTDGCRANAFSVRCVQE